jgi:hypothetical protein
MNNVNIYFVDLNFIKFNGECSEMDTPKFIDMSPDADLRLSNFSNQVQAQNLLLQKRKRKKHEQNARERERVIGALITVKVENLGEILHN